MSLSCRAASRGGNRLLTALLLIIAMLCCLAGPTHAAKAKITYYYTDPQGTVLAKADEQGNIISQSERKPYGEQVMGSPENGPGYTGHVDDPDSGLIYMQARYYDPLVGRFVSVDPVTIEAESIQTFGRYSYASNNPFVNIDPDGRQTLPLSTYQVNWQDPITRQVAAQYALNIIPGYGLYSCASNGCGGYGWTVAGVSTGLSFIGGISRAAQIAKASSITQLGQEVSQVHGALDTIAQNQRTTAGLLTAEGKSIFAAGAKRDLSPSQRIVVESLGGESTKGEAAGLHAEVKVLSEAKAQRLNPEVLSTSRPICEACQNYIQMQGGKLINSNTAIW